MTAIRYTGEVNRSIDGREFTARVDVTFPTQEEAQQFGHWLHLVIKAQIEANGGMLKPIAAKRPPPGLVLPDGATRA